VVRPALWALFLLSVVAVCLPGSAAARKARGGANLFPVFVIGGDFHDLGQANGVYFDLYNLTSAPKPAMITIQTPAGYGVSLVHRPQFVLGDAEVDTNRGAYKGEFEVAPRQAFDADPATKGCAEGTHAATWWMVLNSTHGELSIPVAVDRRGPGYLLTVCLGSLQKLKLTANEIYFATRQVFRNPSKPGNYRFSALVYPIGADGKPNPKTRYEMRGTQPIPEDAKPKAVYNPATKTLTVVGTLMAAGKPRVGINVHIYGGQSTSYSAQKEIGYATTGRGGIYTFTRKLSLAPRWIYAYIFHYRYPICSGPSSAPAGCASQSTDGVATDEVPVKIGTSTPSA
jgi:hypothetical protein